jgi:hypothetical protein
LQNFPVGNFASGSLVINYQLTTQILSTSPELGSFIGIEQTAIQQRFKEYDRQIIELQRKKIEFFWWDDDGIAEIHPRYLVTEKGGIRFDKGFVEPNIVDQQEAETDVLMMTLKMTASVSQKYREESSPYNVVDKHVLNGAG